MKNLMKKVVVVALVAIMAIGTITIMGGGGSTLPTEGVFLFR